MMDLYQYLKRLCAVADQDFKNWIYITSKNIFVLHHILNKNYIDNYKLFHKLNYYFPYDFCASLYKYYLFSWL
jgi:hypothetical protein